MVASGLPTRNGNKHAGQIAEMAISILRNLKDFSIKALPDRKISIRIGMHTGSVCAGKCSLHAIFLDHIQKISVSKILRSSVYS